MVPDSCVVGRAFLFHGLEGRKGDTLKVWCLCGQRVIGLFSRSSSLNAFVPICMGARRPNRHGQVRFVCALQQRHGGCVVAVQGGAVVA